MQKRIAYKGFEEAKTIAHNLHIAVYKLDVDTDKSKRAQMVDH